MKPVGRVRDHRGIETQRQDKLDAEVRAEALEMPVAVSSAVTPFPMSEYLEFRSRIKILTKDRGLVCAPQLGSQKYLIFEIAKAVDEGKPDVKILKGRQQGASTELRILSFFWMCKYDGLCASYAVHELRAAASFRQAINLYYAHLPKTHKYPKKTENREMLLLDNESSLAYLVAGTKERKTGMGRSGSYNFLFADEVAFWGTPDDIKQFEATLSSHYPHRLYLWASTANGMNHFEEMCKSAEDSPSSKFVFIGWYRNELYALQRGSPLYKAFMPNGEHTAISRLEGRRIREVLHRYGVEVNDEQLSWYRWVLSEKFGNDQNLMDQEHPWLPEDAFIATGAKYFSNQAITEAIKRARRVPFKPFKMDFGDHWFDTEVLPGTAKTHDLKIWEEPQKNSEYVIGCDPAFGSSDLSDRTAICVMRCFADRCTQVAEFASNEISTAVCAWAIAWLGGYYGKPELGSRVLLVLEISGPGQDVKNELSRLKALMAQRGGPDSQVLSSMRSFIYRRADAIAGSGSWHLVMTRNLKWLVFSELKVGLETHTAIINSVPCIEEMQHIQIADGNIEGKAHHNDDRCVAEAYAIHGWKEKIQQGMIAAYRTMERELNPEAPVSPLAIDVAVVNYLKTLNIGGAVPKP